MTTAPPDTGEWSLTDKERQDVVDQATKGISSLCFFGGNRVDDSVAAAAAKSGETKAYTRAKVESKTTTGSRPRKEVQRAYFRILSQYMLESSQDGCASVGAAAQTVTGASFDVSGTGREFVTHELAEEMFAPMLQQGAAITAIKLSTKSIGTESAAVVVRGIANIQNSLTHADISDIIAGRPEVEVLSVLRSVSGALAKCRLFEVNISDNALGEKGIRACAAVLSSQPELKALYLQNIGCSVNACAAVDELVKCSTLEKVHLFNNMSDNEGAASIAALLARSPHMRDFKMAASRVGLEGGSALVAALATSSALRSLDLTDNPMEPAAGAPLASLLPVHPHLTALILNDLCLQDEGIAPVAAALATGACPALATLELALNEITSESTPGLAAALAAHANTLRRVNLSENELGCAGAVHVAAGLRGATALEELDVNTNEIGLVGAREVARCCCDGKPALRSVSLDGNAVPEATVSEIDDMFEAAFPGKGVLAGWEENEEGGEELEAAEAEEMLTESRAAVGTLPDAVEADLALDMDSLRV